MGIVLVGVAKVLFFALRLRTPISGRERDYQIFLFVKKIIIIERLYFFWPASLPFCFLLKYGFVLADKKTLTRFGAWEIIIIFGKGFILISLK
jgi:hypothetical protein